MTKSQGWLIISLLGLIASNVADNLIQLLLILSVAILTLITAVREDV